MIKRNGTTQKRRSGVASVELAMLLPILALVLFGTIEMGSMFSAYLRLHNMAREGARAVALGDLPEVAIAHARSAGALNEDAVDCTLEYREYDDGSGWGEWVTLGTDGGTNNAPVGAQVRVQIDYDYSLVVGRFFSCLADDPHSGTKVLTCHVVMCRE